MSHFNMYESDRLPENLPENLPDNFSGNLSGNFSDPLTPISTNRSSQSVLPPSTNAKTSNAKTRESLANTAQNIDSSAITPEESTEDSSWETVNFPGAMSVDDLEVERSEVTSVAPEAPELLPLDYYKLTLAQIIEAQKLVTQAEEPSASEAAELSARVEYLENLLSQYRGFLEDQQLNAAAQEAQLEEKIRALQVAQAQINHLTEELAVCQETIQDQWQEIAELSKNWQQSQERLAQLERECATTQQRYREQVHLNIQVTNTCRELRARLNRQQRQALQFKAALEKAIENQASTPQKKVEDVIPTHSLQEVFSREIMSDRTEDPLTVSPGVLVSKSVPIQPWYTTASKTSVFELEEKRERMMETPELPPCASFSPGSAPAIPGLQSANSLGLPNTSGVVGENYLTELKPNLEDDSANPPSDLPEVLKSTDPLQPMNPITPQTVKPTQNWPAPVVYPERSAKKRRSLAAVELPSFPTKR